MKAPKSLALGLATALAAGGVTSIITATAAQASSENFNVTSQVAPNYQGTAVPIGSRNFDLTVSPATAAPGAPITIVLTSSNLSQVTGPASDLASGLTEIDAVVNLAGVDYVLRGSAIGQNLPKNSYDDAAHTEPVMFNGGWVISSTPGASASTSTIDDSESATWQTVPVTASTLSGNTGTVAGSGGIGATIRGAEATPVSMVAPATPGDYPLTLKAVVVNSTGGTNSPALTDTFDSVINTAVQTNTSPGALNDGPKNSFNNNVAGSYFDYATDVELTVVPPAVATIGSQTNGATTVPAATPPSVRIGDVLSVSSGANTSWTPSTQVRTTVCANAAGTIGCAPSFAEAGIFTGTVTANGSGAIPATNITATSYGSGTGAAFLIMYQGAAGTNAAAANRVAIPITLLTGDRSATAPAGVQLGTAITVTGSNFYPGETVTLSENRVGTDSAGTDADATAVVGSNGSFSKAIVVTDAQATSFTATGIGGAANTGAFAVKNLNGSFSRTPAGIWATQTVKVTPAGVTPDVNTVTINWGDGAVTAGSKTAAVSHKYTATGTKTIKVTLKNTATGVSVVKTVGSVVVTKDSVKPVPTLTTPKKATKGSSWKTIKGKVTDKGLGAKSVTVKLVVKKGGKWYYLKGSSWKKASSKSAAFKKASSKVDSSVSTGAWSIKGKKPAKGTLYVQYFATDKAGNKSATKSKTQKIKS